MNWKNTWILVGLAAALFAFIFLFERRLDPTGATPPAKLLFATFKPTTATSVTLRRGKQFTLVLERTNDNWRFTKPFVYPAANFTVQSFLETLEKVTPATHISPREILSRKQTEADFGFDAPLISLVLERPGARSQQLRFGARTPAGDQVYVDIIGQPGIFLVSADLLDRMPLTPYDWRNTALFHLGEEKPDRVEIAHGATGYVLQMDPTNKLWRLTVGVSHRANQYQVQSLLDKILAARVVEFVTDEPAPDAEAFGLQTPEFEVTVASGPSLVRKVQFGRSPAGDPSRVYARILSHSNIVLVAKSAVEVLATPYTQLRDPQLVSFAPEFVDTVDVRAEETFALRKDSGRWKAGDVPADPVFVARWLALLSGERVLTLGKLEIEDFVKDVVIDFKPFGLDPPQRQYTLRTAVTNASGVTNIPLAHIGFGTNGTGRMFARRWDEDSVYAIGTLEYSHMPGAAWQFREHRVWEFTTNQVARIAVKQEGNVREIIRQPDGEWIPTKGWTGATTNINPFALEETTRALGELTAVMWVARGEAARERFGFAADSPQVTVELRGEKPRLLTVEFGGPSPLRLPYALTTIDGQPTVFEFPWTLYADLQRYLHLAAPPRKVAP